MSENIVAGSFRDLSGYVYFRDGLTYRRINDCYRDHYKQLIKSGLYARLTEKGLLVPHKEIQPDQNAPEDVYLDLLPEQVPFISYPYEWSFSQLRDGALLTLDIQIESLQHDMSLKDASAYNIQYMKGKPVFIDSLSFEPYKEGQPWIAYQQFCQHFLAPLALMSFRDISLNQLLTTNIDGIPIGLASKLLPWRTYLRFGLLVHIHLLAMAQSRYASTNKVSGKVRTIGKKELLGIIGSLRNTILKLHWNPDNTEWADYYEDNNNYELESLMAKESFVSECITALSPKKVWDFGANTGRFSKLASAKACTTIAFDIDPACVEINYRNIRKEGDTCLLPLLYDLTNPSPGIGWDNREREPLVGRAKPDVIFALALIHHLAISNNLPLGQIAAFLARYSPNLVIEFVPKSDSMVQRLLATREDIFTNYTAKGFEAAFCQHFSIIRCEKIAVTERTLYLMERKE